MKLSFPPGFMWGASTASYQIEGAAFEDGRGLSIWDAFSHTPRKIANNDTGDKATDHYHLFRSDVALMKQMNLPFYRFSISWSRLLPSGRVSDGVNIKGKEFYNALLDELIANEIQPVVTLYHWDLPLALQTEYDGWLCTDSTVIQSFVDYASLCFELFGDRVKYWLTFNEPWCAAVLGHVNGAHAPGRSHSPDTEPYRAAHSMLLAHAKTVKSYRDRFRQSQRGKIGITLNCDWREPKPDDDSSQFERNGEAADRSLLFELGWFADPIYFGDYPQVMKDVCRHRLPEFTLEERQLLKGSSDFFGLNHYSTRYCTPQQQQQEKGNQTKEPNYWNDEAVELSSDPQWKKTDMGWDIVPWGFRKLVTYIQKRYSPNGGILVTENGCAVRESTPQEARDDTLRVEFYKSYLDELHRAMEDDGVDCRGYFAWSFLDNFEWSFGYEKRFGLHYVDYETMERVPKGSAKWFANVIAQNGF